jgi:FixJ family two-component response regulator
MPLGPTRIAVVDDDAAVRKALARLLAANAFHAETFASAQNFLESLADRRPDCLVVDLQMPDMTGLELLVYLVGAGIPIPTIIMTAFNETGLRERCAAAGASAYLVKPLRDRVLIGAITDAVVGAGVR